MEPMTDADSPARAAFYVGLVRRVQQAMDVAAERFPALGAHVPAASHGDLDRTNQELRATATPAVQEAFDAWVAALDAVDRAIAAFNEFRDNHHADGPAEQGAYTAELTRRIADLRDRREGLERQADRLELVIADELTASAG